MAIIDFFGWRLVAGQVCLVLLSLLIWRRYLSPISNVPGPFLASLSRVWHTYHFVIGDHNFQLVKLHDRHGHFVRMAHDEVSVSHPDAVRKLLLAPLEKGYWYAGLTNPDYRFIAPFAVTKPKAKVELSKGLASGYSISSVLQAEITMDRTIENLLGWMDKHSQTKEPMRLDLFLRFTAFDILGDVIFSKQFGLTREGRDVGNAIATVTKMSFAVIFGYYSRWRNLFLTNPLTTWLQILPMGYVHQTVMETISERQKNADARFDIVAHWFKSLQEHPDRLTLRNIQAQASNSVAAGADTVASALQTFTFFVTKNPEALARVRGEIEVARGNGLCDAKVVTYDDAQKLPYLQACIKEALRFCSPVTMSLPRVAPAGGITIGDRTFPKGTILSINHWVIHRSKEIWGPDAREFNADRWFREDAAELEKKYFIPFGVGYASCPGHQIARIELSKILATLMRDYDIQQVDKNQQWKCKGYMTVIPDSWPVYIEKRSIVPSGDSPLAEGSSAMAMLKGITD